MINEITMKNNMDPLITAALREDISSEDISTNAVVKADRRAGAQLLCKEDGIIAGLDVFRRVFKLLDSESSVTAFVSDGDRITSGQLIASVEGNARALLSGERTALNFLQRMSGIATYTNEMVRMLDGTGIRLLDTRKTTPNMRIFEKYAVKVGGGYNHRYNLSDGIMLKDNHINAAGGVARAVEMAREYASFVHKIEVEVENLEMLAEALEAGADIIMLDNMSDDDMRKAVALIDGRAETECSGNVTKENIKRLADIGVDYVSSGALTHSAPILDLSLKNLQLL
jgi:nicotinate-nucleotide pyrophosphorylase (carboxylating)